MSAPVFDPWAAIGRAQPRAFRAYPDPEISTKSTISTQAAPEITDFEERAAVLEYEGGVDRRIAEKRTAVEFGFASKEALQDALVAQWQGEVMAMTIPDSPSNFWRQALTSARQAFLQGWVKQAAALGWTEIDLFGVHPKAAEARIDCKGLIPILAGRPILAITRDECVIDVGDGRRLTFYRANHNVYGEAKPIWEVAASH